MTGKAARRRWKGKKNQKPPHLEMCACPLVPAVFPACRGEKSCPRAWVHRATDAVWVMRQCKCRTPEAPCVFLVRIVRGFVLVDSGDVAEPDELEEPLAQVVGTAPLLVIHSHRHTDHIRGDAWLARRPNTVVAGDMHAIAAQDAIRPLVAVPLGRGHSDADWAFIDPRSRVMLSGDVLYRGFLYVRYWNDFREEIRRINDAVKRFQIEWILGCHIEMDVQGCMFASGEPNVHDEANLALESSVVEPLLKRLDGQDEPCVMKLDWCQVTPV